MNNFHMMAIGISVTVACVHYVTSTSYNDICEILYSIYILLSIVNFKDSETAVVPQGFILKEEAYILPHKKYAASRILTKQWPVFFKCIILRKSAQKAQNEANYTLSI